MTFAEIVARTGWTDAEARVAAHKLAVEKRVRILVTEPALVVAAQAVGRIARRRCGRPWKRFIARIRCCREFPNKNCARAPETAGWKYSKRRWTTW